MNVVTWIFGFAGKYDLPILDGIFFGGVEDDDS